MNTLLISRLILTASIILLALGALYLVWKPNDKYFVYWDETSEQIKFTQKRSKYDKRIGHIYTDGSGKIDWFFIPSMTTNHLIKADQD